MNHRRVYSRSGVFAWSGSRVPGGGLVVAEAAQQIDLFRDSVSSFFDFLSIEDIFRAESVNPIAPTRSVVADFKFNDLAWSPFLSEQHPSGLIVGGGESGHTSVFDAAALQGGKLECLGVRSYHQGHVLSVDVSSVNPKWVCSGGTMGSVLMWDMNKPLDAVTPGKPNFEHQIKCVSWNRCSEHLLGSVTSERCSIWDLRSPGSPALDIADIGGGVEWSTMRWSPVCGTELCMASQNDQAPMLCKWDLRYASSAVLAYQLHSRGIFAMDWCPKDPDILVTVGKDEQIIFQNPNTGKSLGQMRTNGWARKLSWCNANPNLFAISYFDQPVSVYSVTPFSSADQRSDVAEGAKFELSVIPAWFRPGPCGAGFSVGNRLCYFSKEFNPYVSAYQSLVSIAQVEGDGNVREWVSNLISALETNQLAEYCISKASSAESKANPNLELIWTFLSTHALNSSRSAYLSKLESVFPSDRGENKDAVASVISQIDAWSLEAVKEPSNDINHHAADAVESDALTTASPKEGAIFGNPVSTLADAQGRSILLNSLCGGSYMEGAAKALSEKNYLFALLLGYTADDQNLLRFIGRSICLDSSIDCATRVAGLMAAGMWDELIASWDIHDWTSLFKLLLSQAPSEKASSLCRKLAVRMHSQGLGLSAAIPAIVGSDVESLLHATELLPIQERISLANVLRQSVGGGSLRVASVGPGYVSALDKCVTQLAKEGFTEEAWKLLEPIDTEHCQNGLRELKYVLYESLGKPSSTSAPEDPYAAVRSGYAQLGRLPAAPSTNFYRSMPQPGYRSIDETTTVNRFVGASKPYPSQFPTMRPDGYVPQQVGAYSTYPQATGMRQPQPQHSPLSTYPSVSAYAPPAGSGYSPTGYSTVPGGFSPTAFSQSSQPFAFPTQNLYSTPASIPPPPMMMQPSGDAYPSYPGRTRTISSSSYSSGPYPQYTQEPAFAPPPADSLLQQQQSLSPGGRRMPASILAWNDPPPLAVKKSSIPATVAEIKWTPATVDQQIQQAEEKKSVTPQPTYSLSEVDSYVINVFNSMVANIRQADKTPVVAHKTADIEQKISTELVPRMSRCALTQETLQLLQQFARYMAAYDFQACQMLNTQLVAGRDFVELSPVMPALRSLLQLAQRTFTQR